VRNPLVAALLLAVAVGATGCGGSSGSGTDPSVKHNAASYDTLDVCSLPDDASLKDALGEAPAARTKRDDDSLKGCVVDGASHRFYLFITVRRSPAGGQEQFTYDRSAVKSAEPLSGVGGDAFSYTDNDEARVEALDGDLVVRVSYLFYTDGGSVSNGPELVGRLSGLLKHLVRKV
jgi:hypothetical protein